MQSRSSLSAVNHRSAASLTTTTVQRKKCRGTKEEMKNKLIDIHYRTNQGPVYISSVWIRLLLHYQGFRVPKKSQRIRYLEQRLIFVPPMYQTLPTSSLFFSFSITFFHLFHFLLQFFPPPCMWVSKMSRTASVQIALLS